MNRINFQQIVNHYIERFEYINGHGQEEYYKWQIAKRFKPMMDAALAASDEEISAKLYIVKKISPNMIDSYTQPFHGLCKFAEKEPAMVRQMFLDLYANDGLSKQVKVDRFLEMSKTLRDRLFPGSFMYSDDIHSVTSYMFLYDPDDNYLYKATHARAFADCIEFYDDWGYGSNTRLEVFNRMCDEVIDEINRNEPLLATAASRYEIDSEGMHPDKNKHILLFDMIYCCSTYNLFKGIHFVIPKNDERRLIQERKEKASRLSAALVDAQMRLQLLDEGKSIIAKAIYPGILVHHRMFGDGKIVSVNDDSAIVDFPNIGVKKLGIVTSVLKGIIRIDDKGFAETLAPFVECLINEKQLRAAVSYAEKQLVPYMDYLD